MNALNIAQSRYTCKAYDVTKKIPTEQLDALLEILRLTPSSINIQAWKFLVVRSEVIKQKIAQAMPDNFAYNIPKVLNSSETIIFTVKTDIDDIHLEHILASEEQAGRFRTPESKVTQRTVRGHYISLYKQLNKIDTWVENQAHIALGNLLFAAQSYGIDATPIGGFDENILDQVLGLSAQGLRSVVIATLGYHGEDDFNADLNKARLPHDQVIEML